MQNRNQSKWLHYKASIQESLFTTQWDLTTDEACQYIAYTLNCDTDDYINFATSFDIHANLNFIIVWNRLYEVRIIDVYETSPQTIQRVYIELPTDDGIFFLEGYNIENQIESFIISNMEKMIPPPVVYKVIDPSWNEIVERLNAHLKNKEAHNA